MATDYLAKKKLADALRRAQMNTAALQGTPMPNTIASPGAQGGGGVYSQPDQVQANWAAPIQGLGLAFMGNRQEAKAAEAEAEAEAAKQAEMEAVMKQGATGQGTITPEMAIKLQNLGVDAATMKLLMPSKTNLGAVTQAARDPAGIRALVATGTWTKEQGDEALTQLAADKAAEVEASKAQYKFEQDNKSHRPATPRAETEIEWAQRDPEGWAKFQKDKARAAMEGKPAPVNPYEKKFQEEQAKTDVKVLEGGGKVQAGIERADKYLAQLKEAPYDGTKYRLMDDAATVVGLPKPSDYSEEVQMQNQDAKQFHLDAMEQMRGFGQVTESEQAIIAATQFDIYDTPGARQKKMETIRAALVRGMEKVEAARKRAQAGGGVPGVAPTTDIDAEIDALMGAPI